MSNDPLLQPYQLKHLTLRNRIMTTSHEPAYPEDGMTSVPPTHHHETAHRYNPKLMEDWDIARVIQDYGDAAERMKAGGMDGLEIECYGHLPDQFWSPLTNLRDRMVRKRWKAAPVSRVRSWLACAIRWVMSSFWVSGSRWTKPPPAA